MVYIDDEKHKKMQKSADKYDDVVLPAVFISVLFGAILFIVWLNDVTGY